MRFFLVFAFIATSAFAQSKRVTLQIKADDKPTVHGFSYWNELKITSKDTSFYYSLHTQNPDVISNLKQGNYTIVLSSVFNQKESRKINLTKKKTQLKFTGLPSYYTQAPSLVNLTEKLKINDTLFIVFSTIGEQINYEKLGVTKTQNGYTAIQYTGLTSDVFQTMQFKDDLYKYVVELETSGKKENLPNTETATVAEVYTIELNKEITSFIVPENWNGLTKVKLILFAVQNH